MIKQQFITNETDSSQFIEYVLLELVLNLGFYVFDFKDLVLSGFSWSARSFYEYLPKEDSLQVECFESPFGDRTWYLRQRKSVELLAGNKKGNAFVNDLDVSWGKGSGKARKTWRK